ncbi:MAG: sensor histidine kinase [Lachnospiraceae bacterium]|nr:sensor histidine kinase [Lachnospiraceae bacterium]
MKEMKEKMISRISNYSLRKKITAIAVFSSSLIAIVSIACIVMTVGSGNALIYRALAGSLSYTASDISSKISSIESMTNLIISNSDVRQNLIILLDEDYEIKKKNAKSTLERLLTSYQQTYKNQNISYISIYSNDINVTSYEPAASSTPEHIHTRVIAETKSNSGYPVWDTSFCNTHGLFLGRESRQVKHLSYRTLGTVVVSVDLQNLIDTSTESVILSDDIQYILMDQDGKVFYHPEAFSLKQATEISRQITSDYQVLDVDSTSYFAVKGNLSANDWQYICLFPYKEMAAAIHTTELVVCMLIVVTMALVLLVTRYLTKLIVSDISMLVQKMTAFSNSDAMDFEICTASQERTDEIGMLHTYFDDMVRQTQNLIQQNYISEILSKEAQLKALENQINPHFLYNTLESVNWRAKAIGETEISAMVEALGSLLRETISAKEKMYSLRHELKIVVDYMTIQKIRYGNRLQYHENVPESLMELQLPPLTIQPLVENAIYYALEEVIGTCHIEVTGRETENRCIISIRNDGSQFEDHILEKLQDGTALVHGFGIGILNIHKRIQIVYGPEYGLELCNEDEDTAVVNIYLPGGNYDKTANC